MHATPYTKQERANWQEMLAPASKPILGVAATLFLFSAIAIPLSHVASVAKLYLMVAAIAYLIVSRSFVSVLALALPGVLLFGAAYFIFPLPLVLPTVYVAIMIGTVSGAFLLIHNRTAKKSTLFALLAVAAYLIPWLLTNDPLTALTALIPAVVALVLGLCLLWGKPLTTSVILVGATLGALAIVASLLALAVFGFPKDGLAAGLVALVREGIRTYFNNVMALYEDTVTAAGGTSLYGSMLEITSLSEHALREYAAAIANLLPGMFVALALTAAYGMWRILLRTLRAAKTLSKFPKRFETLTVSAIGAGIFMATYVFYLLAGNTLFGLVCFNVSIVLTPALALVGFLSLLSPGKARSCLSLLLAFGIVFLLMQNLVLGLSLAAFVGAFHTLLSRFMPPYNKGES